MGAAILFTIGKTLGNASLTLIGQCLLGTIEKEHSMQEVHQTPWGPLYWEKGLLERTIADIHDLKQPISQECIDVITRAVESDEALSEKLAEICETLQSKSLISDDAKMTIDGIAVTLVSELPEREAIEMRNFTSLLQSWHDDKQTISDIEQDIIEERGRQRFMRNNLLIMLIRWLLKHPASGIYLRMRTRRSVWTECLTICILVTLKGPWMN